MIPTLQSGYAETSTRKYPREPEIVIVSDAEIQTAVFQMALFDDDGKRWFRFKVRGKKRYYFQLGV